MKTYYRFLITMITVAVSGKSAAYSQKITDTIFYNRAWQICEKPIASYYRIGTLMVDSFWYFTGKIKDYDTSGKLINEAEYNEKGHRDGLFRFYYPDGKLMLSGNYWQGMMVGDWQWYYPNDSLKAVINFDGLSDDFKVVQFKLPDGTATLDNGTGKFEWFTNVYTNMFSNYRVAGSFSAGKRSGSWRYYLQWGKGETYHFEEKYDKTGNLKKISVGGNYYGNEPKTRFTDYIFIPTKMLVTEQIQYDNVFRRGDSSGGYALLQYLLNRKAAEIIVSNKNVENALLQIIHSLEINRGRLEHQKKEIDASLEFRIGEKGAPEDITINGKGLTEKEKEFIVFLVSKFSKIEMPAVEAVAIEQFYKINIFSVNMKEYVPVAIRNEVNNEIFFSTLPKEKFLVLLNAAKKKIKRFIREELQFYW